MLIKRYTALELAGERLEECARGFAKADTIMPDEAERAEIERARRRLRAAARDYAAAADEEEVGAAAEAGSPDDGGGDEPREG